MGLDGNEVFTWGDRLDFSVIQILKATTHEGRVHRKPSMNTTILATNLYNHTLTLIHKLERVWNTLAIYCAQPFTFAVIISNKPSYGVGVVSIWTILPNSFW